MTVKNSKTAVKQAERAYLAADEAWDKAWSAYLTAAAAVYDDATDDDDAERAAAWKAYWAANVRASDAAYRATRAHTAWAAAVKHARRLPRRAQTGVENEH